MKYLSGTMVMAVMEGKIKPAGSLTGNTAKIRKMEEDGTPHGASPGELQDRKSSEDSEVLSS